MFDAIDKYAVKDIADHMGWKDVLDIYFYFPKKVVSSNDYVAGADYILDKQGVWSVTCGSHYKVGKMHIVSCAENIKLVFFRYNPALFSIFKGKKYVFGTIKNMLGGPAIIHPYVINSVTPFYPTIFTSQHKEVKQAIGKALKSIPTVPEWLPSDLIKELNLPRWHEAINIMHNKSDTHNALLRLAIDEMFVCFYCIAQQRRAIIAKPILPGRAYHALYQSLSRQNITLSPTQEAAISAIRNDMQQPAAMNRIIHGEVGSGKTIVSVFACLTAVDGGFLAVMLCPTTALAYQHYNTFKDVLTKIGGAIKVELCTSGNKSNLHDADIVVGSHALLHRDLDKLSKPIGVAVIDEEHKFGAAQKSKLCSFGNPHRLLLSATPIPRSSYLIKYGYYEVSLLSRVQDTQIETFLYPAKKLDKLEDSTIEAASKKGSKVYWICADIENTLANREASLLKKGFTPIVMHGKSENKQDIIARFSQHGVGGMLLATTVVEVGIDVPTADIIIIETPCQFGLSQLHQLRGRVGRGGKKGYCGLVVPQKCSSDCMKRLATIKESLDCQYISDLDLKSRGPGSICGTEQSGFMALRFSSSCDLSNYVSQESIQALKEYSHQCTVSFNHPAKYALEIYTLNHQQSVDNP